MSRLVRLEIISFLVIALGLVSSQVFGTVESINVSPSVIAVSQPITFSGVDTETISPNNPENAVVMHVYPGFDCSFTPSNSIAFTMTPVNPSGAYSGTYNTTLSFPVPVVALSQAYYGGWAVTSQSYQNGLPPGPYSVAVTDLEALANGAAGVCKNFTVVSSSAVTEFSDPSLVMCSALASSASFLLLRRRRQQTSRI